MNCSENRSVVSYSFPRNGISHLDRAAADLPDRQFAIFLSSPASQK
jgi:hypothetical protein